MKKKYISPLNRVAELDTTACLLTGSDTEPYISDEEMNKDTEQLGRTQLPTVWDSEW